MNESVLTAQSPDPNGNKSRIARALLEARRELIRLTRRNRLLHTERTGSKPPCLEIIGPDPDNLCVALTRDDKHFAFLTGAECWPENARNKGPVVMTPVASFFCP
jgi:hypothetical protein